MQQQEYRGRKPLWMLNVQTDKKWPQYSNTMLFISVSLIENGEFRFAIKARGLTMAQLIRKLNSVECRSNCRNGNESSLRLLQLNCNSGCYFKIWERYLGIINTHIYTYIYVRSSNTRFVDGIRIKTRQDVSDEWSMISPSCKISFLTSSIKLVEVSIWNVTETWHGRLIKCRSLFSN